MRHHYKKIKFARGQDATQMMLFKLSHNFLKSGVITLTEKRAKILRSHLERLIVKAKSATQADKNMITSALRHRNLVKHVLEVVAPSSKRETGFFRLEKLMPRMGDAAKMIRMSYVDAIPAFDKNILKPKKETTEIKAKSSSKKLKIDK